MFKNVMSDTIRLIRFPLIVLVVAIHVVQIYPDPLDTCSFIYLMIKNGIARCAVPLFFLISGYLFFIKADNFSFNYYNRNIKKRVNSLLVPYLLWNLPIVYFCLKNSLGKDFFYQLGCGMGILPLVGPNSFEPPVPFDSPMWYVRDLFVMAIISPLIYVAMRRRIIACIIIILLSISMCMQLMPDFCGLSNTSLLFFSVGAFLALHPLSDVTLIRLLHYKGYILGLLVAVWLLLVWIDVLYSLPDIYSIPWHGLQIIFGCCSVLLGFASLERCSDTALSVRLSSSTFFIYCAHYYFCIYFTFPLYRSIAPFGAGLLAFYIISIMLVVMLCIILSRLGNRYLPAIMNILSGNRAKQ